MRIELLTNPDCPHAASTRQLLLDALAAAGIDVPVIEHVGAHPSPTVRINGVDVMRPNDILDGQMCRLDPPTTERLAAALA